MAAPHYRVASPPAAKPLLLWDGDCDFCRLWAERWGEAYGDRVNLAASQSASDRFPEIPADAFAWGLQLIECDGRVFSGAAAAIRMRRYGRGPDDPLVWLHENIPGVAFVCETGYAFVVRHRTGFSRLTRALCGPTLQRPRFACGAAVFLRLLALVYLCAFASFWWQLDGLVGRDGILPAQDYLDAVAQQAGASRFFYLPTLCWFFGGGVFLHVACAGGVLLAAALFFRLVQPVCLLLLWLLYLSLCGVGQVFLSYQWDALLLETGLLAIFLVPWRWRAPRRFEPAVFARWLLWWLLFRLMFMSGFVKLASADTAWLNGTALQYHYETQPLPTWVAWYAHQMPAWLQRMSCMVMFAVELAVPFLLFGPRRLRIVAALNLIVFQGLIALTGNYTFFNLLTAALCVLFLDDGWWARFFRRMGASAVEINSGQRAGGFPSQRGRTGRRLVFAAFFAASLVVTLPQLMRLQAWPGWLVAANQLVGVTRSVNSYGLFAVMTTRRPEIVIEGSRDGIDWQSYEFNWKPGDLRRRPGFVAPYQPRLDWQLWFAALEYPDYPSWVPPFLRKLADNAPAVTTLLKINPFAAEPPRYLRALIYDYEFTTPAERARTGAWWKRTLIGNYLPVTRVH